MCQRASRIMKNWQIQYFPNLLFMYSVVVLMQAVKHTIMEDGGGDMCSAHPMKGTSRQLGADMHALLLIMQE